jgi:hypothetical protein
LTEADYRAATKAGGFTGITIVGTDRPPFDCPPNSHPVRCHFGDFFCYWHFSDEELVIGRVRYRGERGRGADTPITSANDPYGHFRWPGFLVSGISRGSLNGIVVDVEPAVVKEALELGAAPSLP